MIIISGISDEGYAKGLIRMGVFDYLAKPFTLDAVWQTVERAVKLQQSKRAEQVDYQSDGKAEEELLLLERAWVEAYARRNLAALERIWADDFVSTSPFGGIEPKAQAMENIRADLRLEYFTTFDRHGSVIGDTAVATGRAMLKRRVQGRRHQRAVPLHKHLRTPRGKVAGDLNASDLH